MHTLSNTNEINRIASPTTKKKTTTTTNAQHPGGNVIFTHAGDDFTDIFAAFHPPTAYAVLEPFYIGDLDEKSAVAKPAAQRVFETSYRELRSKLLTMGMYNSE